MITCLSCNKPLSQTESVIRGMGRICANKKRRELEREGVTDKTDLPFDPITKDIVCERREDGLHFNIYRAFRHHSPSGMEWGYSGSGPADFALNILEIFAREAGERPTIPLGDGHKVTYTAWAYHQQLKASLIFDLPKRGGVIKGDLVRRWIKLNVKVH